MKIRRFFTCLCFLFIAFACSMEDENILNDIEQGVGNDIETVEASIKVRFMGVSETKAGESVASEKELVNAVVFLLDKEGKVENAIWVNDQQILTSGISLITKKGEGKSIYVVANVGVATKTALLNQTTFKGIQDTPLNGGDLKLLPKVSSQTESVDFRNGTSANVTVKLEQRTSRIYLTNLTYQFTEGTVTYNDLTLSELTMINLVVDGRVVGNPENLNPATSFMDETYQLTSDILGVNGQFDLGGTDKVYFDTYANNSKNVDHIPDKKILTTLLLVFKIDGGKKTIKRICIVKTDGQPLIEAGYVYQLDLNAIISSGEMEVAVKAKLLDWDYQEVNLGDIDAE